MTKYRPYSRRVLRGRFKSWVKGNPGLIALLAAGTIAVLAIITSILVLAWPASGATWYVLGVLHAAGISLFANALFLAFLTRDTEAIWHLRGAWGEENTRSELERAKRKRLIWGWVDSLSFQAGDIDHLVVTRAGGLIAIDSKWRNRPDSADHQAMVRAANKAKMRAEAVFKTLLKEERGSHRARSNPFNVTPVVVLWGAVQREVPDDARIEGIDFVGGKSLLGWLTRLSGEPVEKETADDLLRRLTAFRSSAWAANAEK